MYGIIGSKDVEIVEHDPNEQVEISVVYLKKRFKEVKLDKPEEIECDSTLERNEDDIEVKIRGLFYDASGYGKVNRNLALKLKDAGFIVRIEPKKSSTQLNQAELTSVAVMEKTKVSRNHILIDSVVPSMGEMSTGRFKVLYTTVESYTVPKQFIECCKAYNEIWVTSKWSASILKKEIKNIPIYVVVPGVDPDLYTIEGEKFDFGPKVKDFVFVSVFGWSYRKGYDVLLKAYFEEFTEHDNVSLLLVTRYQGSTSKSNRDRIKNDIAKIIEKYPNKDLPHVTRYSQLVPENDMPLIYRAANCFVLPSRGEGICIPPMEAAMCGLPVISTNCSGQQQYLTHNNSYLIEIDNLVKIQTGQMHVHYWDNQKFPALTSDKVLYQLGKVMRRVYNNIEKAKNRTQMLRTNILQNYTWTHTANSASQRLKQIHEKMNKKV